MKIFDFYNASLDGTKLIEASAGTGKTYTLSGLYIRYIVEKKLMPEQILVLTFTTAATSELKTRLREQLIQCKKHLLGMELVDKTNEQLFELYEKYKQDDESIKHIEYALICFDQAAIHTINGFCQKVIDDFNSDCGSPVFNELIVKSDYIEKFVYEFWRIQQKKTSIEFLSMLPPIDKVISKMYGLLNKSHYHQVLPIIDWKGIEGIKVKSQKLMESWQENQDTVLEYMFCGSFGRKYGNASKEKFRIAMGDFLSHYTLPTTNVVERFTSDFLQAECKKPVDLEMPGFITEFTLFYHSIIYNYGEKATSGNNIAISYVYECFNYVVDKFTQMRNHEGKYDYTDQITVVHDGIKNNPNLVNKIAQQWQCIMVDEFQDTDQLQLDIFDKCFNDGTHDLIYVGDPKQAIYDFRGADVFVYNQAKNSVKQQFNLSTNWRSSDKMLAASNAMFSYENIFKFEWLTFIKSNAKPDQASQLIDIYPPVALMDCPKEQRKQWLANEIKRYLGSAKINNKKVKSENCAIIVNINQDAIDIYEFLLAQDIAVSLWSESGVFATEVANQLYYLVRALNYPSLNNLTTSLHGLFFDVSLTDLQEIDMEQQIAEFVNYRLQVNKSDVVTVIESILHNKDVYGRLLQRIDGERHYADLQHILELLNQQVEQGCNQNQLEQWLATQIKQTQKKENDEQRKRRIESDSKKISIMTIHKSKGLEFDTVFIPNADKISDKNPKGNIDLRACLATHDENNQGKLYWQHSKVARKSHLFESQAENIRNLYVAITRAKHRVYLGIDTEVKTYEKTPIYKLISMIKDDENACGLVEDITTIAQASDCQKSELTEPLIFKRHLKKPQSIYSFSALSKKQNISFEISNEATKETDYSNYFQFPKGAKSGTMQHEILENLNFDAPMDDIQIEVSKQLVKNSYDKKWQECLSQQIHKILNTQLWENSAKLSAIRNHVDEMEFMLPIGSIDNDTIAKWLTIHRQQDTEFTQDNLQGYLTGFIDLVFEYDEKYYVVDYKSNYLGASFNDYTTDDLKAAIQHHYYDFQYLLYSVALVKYLQNKVEDFDYKKHFGGIAYIFTRGINGQPAQGVYSTTPDEKLIKQMIGEFDAS